MAEKEKKTENEKKVKSSDKPSLFSRIAAWFRSLRSEAKKISWASASSVRKNTIIVIISVVVICIAIGIIDVLLTNGIVGLSRIF